MADDTVEETEDELTLEELEEQQRQIWAALENADTATNSDCETPAMGTPLPSSPSMSTPAHVDTETEMEDHEVEEVMDTNRLAETTCQLSEKQRGPEVQEVCLESPGPIKSPDDSPQSPDPIKSQDDSPQSPDPVKSQDDSPKSPGPSKSRDDSPQSPDPIKSQNDSTQTPDLELSAEGAADGSSPKVVEKITAVPHWSKFAAGIVPFEDTPEYTEVAEATGTYLRIRDLLKRSPRNLSKIKNKNLE